MHAMCLTCEIVGHITSSILAICHTHAMMKPPNKRHLQIMDKKLLHQLVRYIEVPLYVTCIHNVFMLLLNFTYRWNLTRLKTNTRADFVKICILNYHNHDPLLQCV